MRDPQYWDPSVHTGLGREQAWQKTAKETSSFFWLLHRLLVDLVGEDGLRVDVVDLLPRHRIGGSRSAGEWALDRPAVGRSLARSLRRPVAPASTHRGARVGVITIELKACSMYVLDSIITATEGQLATC